MADSSQKTQAVDLLQDLGLKEYEAKCFVALCCLPQGTAKSVSNISDVPRTRVYDATRVLEEKGLVEVQHSNPQQFRAVDIEEAVATLEREYSSRMDTLRGLLDGLPENQDENETERKQEVWTLSGEPAITNRLCQLAAGASEEILIVTGNTQNLSEKLTAELDRATDSGVSVTVGTLSESTQQTVESAVPQAHSFSSDLEWLVEGSSENDPLLTRIALVDEETILVGSLHDRGTSQKELATVGSGGHNGMVIMVKRLLSSGLDR